MTTYDDLISRLEALEGPNYDVDTAIHDFRWSSDPFNTPLGTAPPYTASIDAALTLVPKGWWWLINARLPGDRAQVLVSTGCRDIAIELEAPTPAIALCIAALRARQAQEE